MKRENISVLLVNKGIAQQKKAICKHIYLALYLNSWDSTKWCIVRTEKNCRPGQSTVHNLRFSALQTDKLQCQPASVI